MKVGFHISQGNEMKYFRCGKLIICGKNVDLKISNNLNSCNGYNNDNNDNRRLNRKNSNQEVVCIVSECIFATKRYHVGGLTMESLVILQTLEIWPK